MAAQYVADVASLRTAHAAEQEEQLVQHTAVVAALQASAQPTAYFFWVRQNVQLFV